jgi:hypothetical protein
MRQSDKLDIVVGGEIAEFIRNFGKLKVQLRRMKEGVYMFGRTKVNMVVTNDKVMGTIND